MPYCLLVRLVVFLCSMPEGKRSRKLACHELIYYRSKDLKEVVLPSLFWCVEDFHIIISRSQRDFSSKKLVLLKKEYFILECFVKPLLSEIIRCESKWSHLFDMPELKGIFKCFDFLEVVKGTKLNREDFHVGSFPVALVCCQRKSSVVNLIMDLNLFDRFTLPVLSSVVNHEFVFFQSIRSSLSPELLPQEIDWMPKVRNSCSHLI